MTHPVYRGSTVNLRLGIHDENGLLEDLSAVTSASLHVKESLDDEEDLITSTEEDLSAKATGRVAFSLVVPADVEPGNYLCQARLVATGPVTWMTEVFQLEVRKAV